MKTLAAICVGWFLFMLASGCNNSQADSVKDAKNDNSAKVDSSQANGDSATMKVSKSDADFMVNAASGGMMEVQLGKIAEKNAGSARVMAFGTMMDKDHTRGGERLKELAMTKNVTLPMTPSNDQQKEMDNLQAKTGNAFDKDYMKMMVNDHKDDIKLFENESKNGTDTDVRNFADSMLHMLHIHLDSAQSIHTAINHM